KEQPLVQRLGCRHEEGCHSCLTSGAPGDRSLCECLSMQARLRRTHSLQQFLVKRLLAGFKVKSDSQSPQRLPAKCWQAQLDQVLLGRNDQTILCLFSCPDSQIFNIVGAVRVVIRKRSQLDNRRSGVLQGATKRLRIANATKRRNSTPTQAL